MPSIRTKCFEEIEYSDPALFHFPCGLPGFEQERAFVFLNRPDNEPLVFMQSALTPELCFILLPVLVVAPRYQLSLDEEALTALQFPAGQQPKIGEEVLCAAIVCTRGDGEAATVNLLAPIVVNLRDRVGIQAIQTQSGYSHRHPLIAQQGLVSC